MTVKPNDLKGWYRAMAISDRQIIAIKLATNVSDSDTMKKIITATWYHADDDIFLEKERKKNKSSNMK